VALRGNCRAPLVGTRTYGKAAVQGVFGLPNKARATVMGATLARKHTLCGYYFWICKLLVNYFCLCVSFGLEVSTELALDHL